MSEQIQDGTAYVLDLAGRQRMLNERLQKEVLAKACGGTGDPEGTLDLLRETALALAHGGEAVLVPGPQPTARAPRPPADSRGRREAGRPAARDRRSGRRGDAGAADEGG